MDVLFAGMRVLRLDRATDWYVRFFGRPADIVPNEREVMWRIADSAWLYVLEDPQQAGQGLVTIAVPDLDAAVRDLTERGITGDPIAKVGGAGRKAQMKDPDGNQVDLIQVA